MDFVEPRRVNISNKYVDFDLSGQSETALFHLRWSLKNKRRSVEPTDMVDYRSAWNTMSEQTYWVYNVTILQPPGKVPIVLMLVTGLVFVLVIGFVGVIVFRSYKTM